MVSNVHVASVMRLCMHHAERVWRMSKSCERWMNELGSRWSSEQIA
jgi:hypothetical protein